MFVCIRTNRTTEIETANNWSRVATKVRCAEKMSNTWITHDLPGAIGIQWRNASENWGAELKQNVDVQGRKIIMPSWLVWIFSALRAAFSNIWKVKYCNFKNHDLRQNVELEIGKMGLKEGSKIFEDFRNYTPPLGGKKTQAFLVAPQKGSFVGWLVI